MALYMGTLHELEDRHFTWAPILESCVSVAGCCSVLHCDAVCCSVLQCCTACCSMLQCVALCCRALYLITAVDMCANAQETLHLPYLAGFSCRKKQLFLCVCVKVSVWVWVWGCVCLSEFVRVYERKRDRDRERDRERDRVCVRTNMCVYI